MTEFVTAREIPSERPLAWRLAHDARVRYVAARRHARRRVLRRGADRLRAEVHRRGRGDRLAAGRRRDRLPVPGRPEPLARGRPGRPAREPVQRAPGRLRDRADDRQHARGPRGRALLRRLVRNGRPLESVPGVCGLLVAIFAGVAVSATIGPISLRLGDVLTTSDLPHVWHTWWLGDTAGALVVVPFALAWWQPIDFRSWTPERTARRSAHARLRRRAHRAGAPRRPPARLHRLSRRWPGRALRFGPRGGTLAVAVAVGFTLWKTAHHAGPFVVDSIPRSTLARSSTWASRRCRRCSSPRSSPSARRLRKACWNRGRVWSASPIASAEGSSTTFTTAPS